MRRKDECPRCGIEGSLQKRIFSDQAIAALVVWEELEESLIDEPVCNHCYAELRDILIERNDELSRISEKDLEKLKSVV